MRNRIIIFFCFLCHFNSFGQNYPIKKYTTYEGLPVLATYSFLKDSRGYGWVGSQLGLSKFDGEVFTNYTFADLKIGSAVMDLQEDKNGYIWGQVNYAGIVKFDGKIFSIFRNPLLNDPLKSFEIADNEVIALIGHSLFHIVGDTLMPYLLKNKPASVKGDLKCFTYFGKTKSLLLHFETQTFTYKNGLWQEIPLTPNFDRFLVSFNDEVLYQNADDSGEIKTYVWNGEANRLFLTSNHKNYQTYCTIQHDFVFTTTKDLYYLKKGSTQAERLDANPTFPNFTINYLKQAEGQSLWLPTTKGLWRVTKKGFKHFDEETVPSCIGVVEDKKGDLYFSNYNIGLQKYIGGVCTTIPSQNYATGFVLNKNFPFYTPGANEWTFKPLKDKFGHLWFPNINGIVQYDNKKWTWFSYKKSPMAYCVTEDKKRDLIVTAGYQCLYTVQNQAPYEIKPIIDTTLFFKEGVGDVVISPIDNTYWFSNKVAIATYNPSNKKFQYYNVINLKSLYFDTYNNLWALSGTDGLYLFNRKLNKFERVLKQYFMRGTLFMEQIDSDNLLIGTFKGLFVFNVKAYMSSGQVKIKAYNHNNGFMGVELQDLGSFRDSKGYVWVMSNTVLTRINPKELDLDITPPKTYITKVGKQAIPFVGNVGLIYLPEGQNSTTFLVESVGENKPLQTQYSFRIKGFLDEWSEWQTQNLLSVNNLSNGEHTFEVRSKSAAYDFSDTKIATIQFYVSAPFYKSPNFYKYSFFGGVFLLLGMLYFWFNERRQTLKNVKQQKHIEQTENKVRFLQVQTIQAQMNPHFTFNVLGTLQHLILNNETQKASDNLVKLSSLIRNYLEASLLGDEQMGSLFKHEIALGREIELLKMYIEFEQLQYSGRFNYEIKLDGKLNPNNYRVPPLIIQPFIENAIKHGLLYKNVDEIGNLWVHFLSLDEDTLICTIEDDGVGRAKAAELQLTSIKKYKSRGTQLVKKRVEILNEMGYEIEINTDDRLKGGTVVTIKIGYK